MPTNEKFKLIIGNMTKEELFNFIWIYDQYVSEINDIRIEEEEYDISPLNIEDFYIEVYKKIIKKG